MVDNREKVLALAQGASHGASMDLPTSPARWGTGGAGDDEMDVSSDKYFNVNFWKASVDWFEEK